MAIIPAEDDTDYVIETEADDTSSLRSMISLSAFITGNDKPQRAFTPIKARIAKRTEREWFKMLIS